MSGLDQDLTKQYLKKLKKELICLECGRVSKNKKSLGVHIRICHGTQIYYDKYIKKEIEGICRECGEITEFINIKRGIKKFCCEKCHCNGSKGNKNPFYGKKHTSDTKRKIVDNNTYSKGEKHHFFGKKGDLHPAYGRKHTDEELVKMHNALVGKSPNINFTKEIRKKISEANLGKVLNGVHRKKISSSNMGKHTWTEEAKSNLSRKVAQAHLDGKLNKNFKSGYFFSVKMNKSFWYRSSYELIAYNLFERDDDVIKIEYEPEKIEIKIDGNNRFSVPDFRITYKNGDIKIIEIKPLKLTKHPKIKKRMDGCKEYYEQKGIKYELWTEKELGIDG